MVYGIIEFVVECVVGVGKCVVGRMVGGVGNGVVF